MTDKKQKVVICIPTISRPWAQTLDSIAASLPLLDEAGLDHYLVTEIGNPYISMARAMMLRKALDVKADIIIFIDHDMSWEPSALLKLIQTDGDVVAGTYRFKKDNCVEYMGIIEDDEITHLPKVRQDGAIKATRVPAGFLKVTRNCINKFMQAYPELIYGESSLPSVDLFHHGAHKGVLWGEDYAFSRNWIDCGGEIWIVPNIELNHHTADQVFAGNFHEYLINYKESE